MNDDPTVLRLERVFDAPPERVYAAWTDPALLRRWWAAEPGWTTPEATTDVRVGGAYRLSMQGTDGILRTVAGEYLEVDPPRRLVYTWKWVSHAIPPAQRGRDRRQRRLHRRGIRDARRARAARPRRRGRT